MRNLLILAKWLAGRADVDVVEYNGKTACIGIIDGRRVISIPRSWSYSSDPQAAELLEGVIDHEALGHGRFTDLEGRTAAEDAGLIKFTALSAAIQNILEDVYIENQAIKTYSGVQGNLQRTVEILAERGFFGKPEFFELATPAEILPGALLNILRAKFVPGQADALDVNVMALEAVLPEKLGQLWVDVYAVASEVQNSKSTKDNIDLTIRIMKLLDDAAAQEPPQPEQDLGADSPSDDEDSAQADEGQNQGGDGQSEGDKSGNQPGLFDEEGQSEAEPSTPPQYSEKEVEAAQNILDSCADDMPLSEMSEIISDLLGQITRAGELKDLLTVDDRTKVSDKSLRVCSQVKSISDELQEALVAETQCEKSTKLSGKSLNNRVLSRVKTGNACVFRRKLEGLGLSTAVSVLFDMSGSMADLMLDGVSRLDAAVGLSYGLADVLDEFDVPFEINAFSDKFSTLKSFSQDWTMVRKSREVPFMSGGTFTGVAMQKALSELVGRSEERRLLIVVTDGAAQDLDVLISCYSEAQLMGVEIVSVMIGPKIASIEALASKFGFKATSVNQCAGLGRYAVDRVLEAI